MAVATQRRSALPPWGCRASSGPGRKNTWRKLRENALRVPYVAGTVASSTVEELAALAGDMLWFQLYRIAQEDHRYGFDLVKRAQAAGAHALVITMDVPLRTKRPREVRRGLVLPFRLDARTVIDVLSHPAWIMAYREHGLARFANYKPSWTIRLSGAGGCVLPAQRSGRGRVVLVG